MDLIYHRVIHEIVIISANTVIVIVRKIFESIGKCWYRYRLFLWYLYRSRKKLGIGIGLEKKLSIGIGIGIGLQSGIGTSLAKRALCQNSVKSLRYIKSNNERLSSSS